MLESKNGFFAHVTGSELVAVQIKNAFNKSFIVSKNFKIEQLRNYDEKDCFIANSKKCHLIITSALFINIKKALTEKKNDVFERYNDL